MRSAFNFRKQNKILQQMKNKAEEHSKQKLRAKWGLGNKNIPSNTPITQSTTSPNTGLTGGWLSKLLSQRIKARLSNQLDLTKLNRDQIISLQTQLVKQGLLGGPNPIDGKLGPRTMAAYQRSLVQQAKGLTQSMDTEQIKEYEKAVNQLDNESIIKLYSQTTNPNSPVIVDDKQHNKLRVYLGGKVIREYRAIHGKNSNSFGQYFNKKTKGAKKYTVKPNENLSKIAKENNISLGELIKANNIPNPNLIKPGQVLNLPGTTIRTQIDPDEMTITYVDSKGHIINKGGNLTTPAGVYFTDYSGSYQGAPAFMRRTKQQVQQNDPRGIPSSIHARTIKEGANTNGCSGMSKDDLKDLRKVLEGHPNTPTFILPSNPQNRFFMRNGEVSFRSHDLSKTPSHTTLNKAPISRITIKDSSNLNLEKAKTIQSFSNSLIKHKAQLQDDLGINNDTYNQLAKYSLGILGTETNYGDEHSAIGNFVRAVRKFINKGSNSSPDYKSKYYTYGATDDNNSIGLTQIRFKNLGINSEELFDKYGITKESLVNDPEKAAIATIIKLADEYKNTGSFDGAIKSWNQRPNYLQRVKDSSNRFEVYQDYNTLN